MLEKFNQIRKETITDSELTAEKYHNFFTDIGPKLAKKLKHQLKLLNFTSENSIFYNLNILWK